LEGSEVSEGTKVSILQGGSGARGTKRAKRTRGARGVKGIRSVSGLNGFREWDFSDNKCKMVTTVTLPILRDAIGVVTGLSNDILRVYGLFHQVQ
jgi:hypothetical protein